MTTIHYKSFFRSSILLPLIALSIVFLDSYWLFYNSGLSFIIPFAYGLLIASIFLLKFFYFRSTLVPSFNQFLLLILVLVYLLFNVAFSPFFDSAISVIYILVLMIALFPFGRLNNSLRRYQNFLLECIFASSLIGLILSLIFNTINRSFIVNFADNSRFPGIFLNSNIVSLYAAILLAMSLILLKRIHYALLFTSFSLLLLSLSQSRGVILGILVFAAVTLAIKFRTNTILLVSRTILLFSIITGFIFFIFSFYYIDQLAELFARFSDIFAESGESVRYNLWSKAFYYLYNNANIHLFIFGLGQGSFKILMGGSSHNTFIRLLFEYGFLGFISYLSLFIFIFYNQIICLHRLSDALLLFPVVVVLITSLTYDILSSVSCSCISFFVLAFSIRPIKQSSLISLRGQDNFLA